MAHKILYLVSEDWYFTSHRLPMARAARQAGHEVHVVTRVDECGDQILREGFFLHPIHWRRGSLNPVRLLIAVLETRRAYREIKPDLVHHVALVPAVVGSLAALGMPVVRLNALAGLGFAFTSNTAKARAARPLARLVLGWLLKRPETTVLVQNPDDYDVVARLGLRKDAITLIPGSGVDTERLQPMPEPSGPFTIAFVGRLLDDKGVRTLVRAHELLHARGLAVQTLIAGDPDPFNPASIPDRTLDTWRHIKGLQFLGHVEDIQTIWARSHVAVLPSRREGLPMSLMEAAACGRPLIATDVPGCREIARKDINALLVPVDNPEALSEAIEKLMNDRDLRIRLGKASRQIVSNEYSSARIGKEITDLYSRLLKARLSPKLRT
jgi:glycosyltransferase involved in cell wall biosynthesis